MSDYRIVEKKNCFDLSRFYIQEKQGNGTWEDINRGERLWPTFFDSYEKAFDYIKNEYRNQYTKIAKTTEITIEDIKRG